MHTKTFGMGPSTSDHIIAGLHRCCSDNSGFDRGPEFKDMQQLNEDRHSEGYVPIHQGLYGTIERYGLHILNPLTLRIAIS